jgi:hypothetical protein
MKSTIFIFCLWNNSNFFSLGVLFNYLRTRENTKIIAHPMTLSVLRHTHLSQNLRPPIFWQRSLTLSLLKLPQYRHRFRPRASQATNSPWIFYPTCVVLLGAAGFIAYNTSQPFRHTIFAVVRCSRVAGKQDSFKDTNSSFRFRRCRNT